MAADKTIEALIKTMEDAIENFQRQIPGIQKGLSDSLLTELKDLKLQDGKILNSPENLKLILNLKNKIERLIIGEGYKKEVQNFIEAFNTVGELQEQYFAAYNYKFKPSKTLQIIKEMSIDKTLNDLLGQGLQSNIVDAVQDVLIANVTAGGSYASMTQQLQNDILNSNAGEGSLQRYTKTITTDAINQYSAQYHETLAIDLNFDWGRYVGSNITTSREFCLLLTAKEWVHRSELPEIIKGHIDGHSCKLSSSTGLPLGMKAGTNVDNFKIMRGGWHCGHQWFWVPNAAVPTYIKARLDPAA